ALIRRVAEFGLNPHEDAQGQQHIAAMAARGYLQSSQLVKEDALLAHAGEPGAALFKQRHQAWYQALFNPSVVAGILERSALVGYRRHFVFLQNSLHSPPAYEHVTDGMQALCECMAAEQDA